MPSPDLIGLFISPLNRIGATYMVTGSIAAMAYGEPRLTTDIDVVIVLSEDTISGIVAGFDATEFYVPPREVMVIEGRRQLHGHFNLIHAATALKADLYPAGVDPLHRWALKNRQAITVGTERVWVAPPEYVILRKLQYLRDGASDKHRADIRAMLESLGERLDRGTLHNEIEALGLAREWASIGSGPKSAEAPAVQERDPLFREAAKICIQNQQGSTSLLQRKLKVGYGRAARIIDQLHLAGVLGPPDASKPRDVLAGLEDLDRICGPK